MTDDIKTNEAAAKLNSTAAALNNSIRHNNGYPVYITDDYPMIRPSQFLKADLSVYVADDLLHDRKSLKDFFDNRKPADTDSPVIFLVKNRTKGVDELISLLSAADIDTYYQDLNYSFKPIVSNNREDIRRSIHEQYRQNFSTASVMKDFIDVINSRVNTPPIPTGFNKLDKALSGGLHEGLISIGANTSLGKTTFIMQIADYIAKSGQTDVMIFSLEMSKHELISKSISRITYERCIAENKPLTMAKTQLGITDGNRYRNYSDAEIRLIQTATEDYKQGIAQGLYIYESVADMTVEQIDGIVRNHYDRTGKYPVVIIDYLQLLQHGDRYINSNDKLRTDVNITSLKRLSRAYKIPVIAISSFNRTSYNQDEVDLSAFKESGGIEYSSDIIIGLKKTADRQVDGTEISERLIRLTILKNRQGQKDISIEYAYNPYFNHYEELTEKQEITIIR